MFQAASARSLTHVCMLQGFSRTGNAGIVVAEVVVVVAAAAAAVVVVAVAAAVVVVVVSAPSEQWKP